jgi:hypothetical protein
MDRNRRLGRASATRIEGKRSLRIHAETLRNLSDGTLRRIAGALADTALRFCGTNEKTCVPSNGGPGCISWNLC